MFTIRIYYNRNLIQTNGGNQMKTKFNSKFKQKTIRDLITDITNLVLYINCDTKLCAWLEIVGHIGCISVYMTKDKDTLDIRTYENICVRYYRKDATVSEISTHLFNLIQINKDLQKILKENKS